jgi:hypothetical protein
MIQTPPLPRAEVGAMKIVALKYNETRRVITLFSGLAALKYPLKTGPN